MGFHHSNKVGKIAEERFVAALEGRKWFCTNVSAHILFQELDIDFIVQKDNMTATVDVKGDKHNPNNFFIETVSNMDKGSQGCIYQTRADYWFYYFFPTDTFYYFKPQRMREHMHNKQFRKAYGYTQVGDGGYSSEGLLVPVADCNFVSVLV